MWVVCLCVWYLVVLDLISLSFQTYIHFLLFYNHCDKSELHVFGPFLFCLRVSWYGGPIRMMNIQEVTNNSCVGRIFNMLGTSWVKIASYECKGVAVIWWMCLFHVRSLVIWTPRFGWLSVSWSDSSPSMSLNRVGCLACVSLITKHFCGLKCIWQSYSHFISEFRSFWSSCESLSFFISLYSIQSSANRRIDEWILFGKSLM